MRRGVLTRPTLVGSLLVSDLESERSSLGFPSQSAIGEINLASSLQATWCTTDRLVIAGPRQSGRASEEKIAANHVDAALQRHQQVGQGVHRLPDTSAAAFPVKVDQ